MVNCIFCKIIDGEIPSSKIYEDDNVYAFLDIGPVKKGHSLVIPKGHYPTLDDIPEDKLKDVIIATKKVANAVRLATGCDGYNIVQNNYPASGQVVHHLHFHIIPRNDHDGLPAWPAGKYSEGEMDKMLEKVKSKL